MHLSRFYTKAKLHLLLAVLALVALWVMIVASSDPLPRFLEDIPLATALEQFTTGNQIAFDLSVGVLSAIGMFYLLVRLPEYERKNRIKRHLHVSYASFKRSVIQTFVGAIQGSYSSDVVDRLMNQQAFRDFFKEPYVPNQIKWDGVANKMDDQLLRQLVLETEVLFNEFQHALSVLDVKDPEVFSFMKRVSEALYRAKNWSADYDGTKEVLRFFWQILSGWNPISGYSDSEYITDMIAKI
jgi:hypothetical protein